MEERTINCRVISPMFSYGAYNQEQNSSPEFRVSELKGLMRYTYRIACPTKRDALSNDEKNLFGGAAGSGGKSSGNGGKAAEHASPLRLAIQEDKTEEKKSELLLHGKKKNNPPLNHIASGRVQIAVRMSPAAGRRAAIAGRGIGLEWYTDLITLSLTLFGLGRRSRKGRGSAAVCDVTFSDQNEAVNWICMALNRVAETSSQPTCKGEVYIISKEGICSTVDKDACNRLRRPLIRKISFGERLDKDQVEAYLEAMDEISHETKDCEDKNKIEKMATGWLSPRLASPLIVSFMATGEGIYPVYTFVHAVLNLSKKTLDPEFAQREEFMNRVEQFFKGGMKK